MSYPKQGFRVLRPHFGFEIGVCYGGLGTMASHVRVFMASAVRVMCVEDNTLVADAIGRKLQGRPGFEWLGCACTAHEALDMVRALSPNVICMDYHIPGVNTFELVARLRSEHPEARVLMVSAHVSEELVNGAIDAGAWGYISKADNPWSILDAIQRVAAGEIVLGPMARGVLKEHRPHPQLSVAEPESPKPRGRLSRWLARFGR